MKLILVRHGERARDVPDDSLTEIGKKQVEYLAKRLLAENINSDLLYTNDLRRSKQTVDIISNALNITYKVEPALNELPKKIFLTLDSEWAREDRARLEELYNFLDALVAQKKDIIFITNAGINRAILGKLLGIPLQKTISFGQKYASFTELEFVELYGKKFWRLNVLNCIRHLI